MNAQTWLDLDVKIIPLCERSKSALHKWGWIHQATSQTELKSHFPLDGKCNLGVLCGRVSNGLVVLDFDNTLAYAKWRAGCRLKTYEVETSRGKHVYFFVDNCPSFTFHIDGIDVKATGYVVGEPSIHPCGWQYIGNNKDVLRISSLADVGINLPEKPSPLSGNGCKSSMANTLVKTIKQSLPIEVWLDRYTTLLPGRGEGFLVAVCPFHDDKKPSLWVNTSWQKCGCFSPGCQANSKALDVIDCQALRHYGGTDIYAVRAAIADLAGELGL